MIDEETRLVVYVTLSDVSALLAATDWAEIQVQYFLNEYENGPKEAYVRILKQVRDVKVKVEDWKRQLTPTKYEEESIPDEAYYLR